MNNPKISIITPCYNSSAYIEKCIISVLNQTYKNIEYIVMDGQSVDGTVDILKRYEDRIIYISEKDFGNYDAIEKGFNRASGEIITWLDSDNYYYQNDVIEKIAECFEKQTPDIIVTDCYFHYEVSEKMHRVSPNRKSINYLNLVNSGNMFMPECIFYRKDLYDKVGGIDLNYKLLADYELWIKMFKLSPKIIKLPIISSVYEIREGALLRKNFSRAWDESFLIGDIYKREFLSKIKFYLLYVKAKVRYFFVSLISKNKRLRKFFIKNFR